MPQPVTRRRVITISSAAAGLALTPFAKAAGAEMATWRGMSMGAVATMTIAHQDRGFAQSLIERCVSEAARLERLFSLYRDDSDLVALNKQGALAAPAAEMVDLLSQSLHYARLTDGVFDITVQPLWSLYARHFSAPGASADGPPAEAIAAARERVGYRHLLVNRDRIAFGKPGMSVTLNGIAQGYITDKIIALLRAEGITQTLVDMGETRCLGTHPGGRPWTAGVADPDQPGRILQTLPIVNQAVATSAASGFQFGRNGRFNHLFDPKTGASAQTYRSVTVVAPTATAADALSTAFSLMPLAAIERVRAAVGGTTVHLVQATGERVTRQHV